MKFPNLITELNFSFSRLDLLDWRDLRITSAPILQKGVLLSYSIYFCNSKHVPKKLANI